MMENSCIRSAPVLYRYRESLCGININKGAPECSLGTREKPCQSTEAPCVAKRTGFFISGSTHALHLLRVAPAYHRLLSAHVRGERATLAPALRLLRGAGSQHGRVQKDVGREKSRARARHRALFYGPLTLDNTCRWSYIVAVQSSELHVREGRDECIRRVACDSACARLRPDPRRDSVVCGTTGTRARAGDGSSAAREDSGRDFDKDMVQGTVGPGPYRNRTSDAKTHKDEFRIERVRRASRLRKRG